MAKRTQSKMWPDGPKPAKKPAKKPKPTRAQLAQLVKKYNELLDAQVYEIVDPCLEKLDALLEQCSNPEHAPVQRAIITEVLRLLDCKIGGRGWSLTYRLVDEVGSGDDADEADDEDVDGRNY